MRALPFAAIALVTAGFAAPALAAQATAPDAAVAEVRQSIDAARKDVEAYKAGGGVPGTADHPAVKWDATLWAYRERYPRGEAAAIATVEAVRLLSRAELWDRAHARTASIDVDDPAWQRLASVIYEEGVARKDLAYTMATLSATAQSTRVPAIKAAALVILGRAYRRQGDKDAATRSLEAAKVAAPATTYAEEADGLIYEIAHLSVGLQAPAIDATTRDGRRVTLADFRGKPVVLVFWGTT